MTALSSQAAPTEDGVRGGRLGAAQLHDLAADAGGVRTGEPPCLGAEPPRLVLEPLLPEVDPAPEQGLVRHAGASHGVGALPSVLQLVEHLVLLGEGLLRLRVPFRHAPPRPSRRQPVDDGLSLAVEVSRVRLGHRRVGDGVGGARPLVGDLGVAVGKADGRAHLQRRAGAVQGALRGPLGCPLRRSLGRALRRAEGVADGLADAVLEHGPGGLSARELGEGRFPVGRDGLLLVRGAVVLHGVLERGVPGLFHLERARLVGYGGLLVCHGSRYPRRAASTRPPSLEYWIRSSSLVVTMR